MKKRVNKKKNKSQVTIFIILGLIIIVLILIFLVLKTPKIPGSINKENPQVFIESCTIEHLSDALEIIYKQGGDIELQTNVMFKDQNISYLCYTQNYLEKCIAQKPMFITHMEDEITNYLTPKVSSCFEKLEEDYGKSYEPVSNSLELETDIKSSGITIFIGKKFTITDEETSNSYEEFKATMASPLYNLGNIASRISDEEAKNCEFNYLNYMFYYPAYEIVLEKPLGGDDFKIYRIKDLESGNVLNTAIRGCITPPGGTI